VSTSRFTVKGIITALVKEYFNLDRGLLYTLLTLSARPGRAIRRYITGESVPLTNPAKYMLIAFIAAGATLFGPMRHQMPADAALYATVFWSVPILVMLIWVPLFALFSTIMFGRSERSYAEQLVFHTYVLAHLTMVSAVVAAAILVYAGLPTVVLLAGQLGLFLYLVWASMEFFNAVGFTGLLRGIGVVALSYGSLAGIIWILSRILS